jgi:hypothetical protein
LATEATALKTRPLQSDCDQQLGARIVDLVSGLTFSFASGLFASMHESAIRESQVMSFRFFLLEYVRAQKRYRTVSGLEAIFAPRASPIPVRSVELDYRSSMSADEFEMAVVSRASDILEAIGVDCDGDEVAERYLASGRKYRWSMQCKVENGPKAELSLAFDARRLVAELAVSETAGRSQVFRILDVLPHPLRWMPLFWRLRVKSTSISVEARPREMVYVEKVRGPPVVVSTGSGTTLERCVVRLGSDGPRLERGFHLDAVIEEE